MFDILQSSLLLSGERVDEPSPILYFLCLGTTAVSSSGFLFLSRSFEPFRVAHTSLALVNESKKRYKSSPDRAMMAAVITPSQQGRRSLSPVLSLLTLAKNLLCLLYAILLVTSPATAQQGGVHQLDEADMDFKYLNSCLDLPNERTPVQGFVAFMANVVCPEPKVRVWA